MKKHQHCKHGSFDGALADVYYNAQIEHPSQVSRIDEQRNADIEACSQAIKYQKDVISP